MPNPTYDVFIAGMGPVGSAAALFAGRAELTTCVADMSEQVYPLPRATHFDAEIMRLFQGAGLAEALEPLVRTYNGGLHLGADGESIRDFRVPAVRGPLGWFPHYAFLQPEVDKLLREAAAKTDGVDCRLGSEVTGFDQREDHVAVSLRYADGATSVVRARYLIACDGASSPIRKSLGIKLDDHGFEEPWIIIDAVVPDAGALPDYSVMYCDPRRPATYIPQPGRHRRWEFMLLEGESAETMASRAAINQLLRPLVNVEGLEIVRSAVYRFHGLIAADWRSGRVFVAGDAAHQSPPFYGQGMCHGIRDVSNLIWKLRLVIDSPDLDGLLDTYTQERYPHVKTIIDAAVENGRYICILDPAEARERDLRLRARVAAGQDVRSFRSVIPGLTSGLLSSAEPGCAERGEPMIQPDVRVDGGGVVMLDGLLGDGFAVICQQPPTTADGLTWFTEVLRGRVIIVGEGEYQTPDVGAGSWQVLPAQEGELAQWFDTHAVSAVLVRPDRYIYGTAEGAGSADALIADLRRAIDSIRADHRRDVSRRTEQHMPLQISRAHLSHLGFYVRDLDSQADFYKRVFGLVETDRGVSGAGDPIVFMTGDSSEHHQLVLTAGLPIDAHRTWLNQVSFRVGTLAELQEFHAWLVECGVTPAATVSHGNAWSIYFLDPEGNNVEVYANSPWYVPQPFREVIDLTRQTDELVAETYASVRSNSGFRPVEQWTEQVESCLKAALTPSSRRAEPPAGSEM